MKTCNFCNTQSQDSTTFCPQCGGNDFKNVCNNCGSVFSAPYCPNCGVKAGRKPVFCPKCGTESYSHHCPECGYNLFEAPRTQAPVAAPAPKPAPAPVPPVHTAPSVHAAPPQEKKLPKVTGVGVILLTLMMPYIGGYAIICSNKYKKGTKTFAGIYCLFIGFIFLMTSISIPNKDYESMRISYIVLTLITLVPGLLWLGLRIDHASRKKSKRA